LYGTEQDIRQGVAILALTIWVVGHLGMGLLGAIVLVPDFWAPSHDAVITIVWKLLIRLAKFLGAHLLGKQCFASCTSVVNWRWHTTTTECSRKLL